MAHLRLDSRGPHSVLVDHCAACRVVWFDTLESVRLTAAGWVRLLRTMQQPQPALAAHDSASAGGCPVCRAPLRPVHNLTRFGRFRVRECPQDHGHLHTYAGLLAERGLVRPLLGPEKQALAAERRALECLNCGAPVDGRGADCSHCASPLVVLDMPRLAHALSGPAARFDASPAPGGPLLAWSCRGCGAPLAPSLQTACPACAHPVVVPSLLDITPVLDTAEAALQVASEAAAALTPLRLEPVPINRRDTTVAALSEAWRDERDDAPVSPWRWVLAAALVVLIWLAAGGSHAAAPPGPANDGSVAARELAIQPLGANHAAAWAWSGAVAAMRAPAEAEAFDRGLLDTWLAATDTEPWRAERTVGAMVDRGRTLPAIDANSYVQRRWADALRRDLRVVWPAAVVALPAELESLAPRMREQAPGLWTSVLADGQPRAATWMLTLEQIGLRRWPVGSWRASLVPFSAVAIDFDCTPPRGALADVPQPGQKLSLLCRSKRPVAASETALVEVARRLTARDEAGVVVSSDDLQSAQAVRRFGERLAASASTSAVDAFYDRFRDCERRGTCPKSATAPAPSSSTQAQEMEMEQPVPAPRAQWPAAAAPLVLLGLTVAYMVLAGLLGNNRAAMASLLGGVWLAPALATKFIAPGGAREAVANPMSGSIPGAILSLGMIFAAMWLAWAVLVGFCWLIYAMRFNRDR